MRYTLKGQKDAELLCLVIVTRIASTFSYHRNYVEKCYSWYVWSSERGFFTFFSLLFFRCYEFLEVKELATGLFSSPGDSKNTGNQGRTLKSTASVATGDDVSKKKGKYGKLLKDRIKLSRMMNKIAQKKAILNCELERSKQNLKVSASLFVYFLLTCE